jgi:hypothetical protein
MTAALQQKVKTTDLALILFINVLVFYNPLFEDGTNRLP